MHRKFAASAHRITSLLEEAGSVINGATKPRTNGQQATAHTRKHVHKGRLLGEAANNACEQHAGRCCCSTKGKLRKAQKQVLLLKHIDACVKSHLTRQLMRSLPALAVTMVL
jgi:hypothetical protein